MRSYQKVLIRDFTQILHISQYKNCENDRCENNICNNNINIKNCFSNFNNLTNKTIFKLMINALRVKIKVINFTTFSLLFRNKFAKIDFLLRIEFICDKFITMLLLSMNLLTFVIIIMIIMCDKLKKRLRLILITKTRRWLLSIYYKSFLSSIKIILLI